ncbi:MAG: Hpt domain-containing protein [Planctomycetales bacterium]|nr:Hpt domain-containing protein [Planctomycetales bacterium]
MQSRINPGTMPDADENKQTKTLFVGEESRSTDTPPIRSTLPANDPEFMEIVAEFVETLCRRFNDLDEMYRCKDARKIAEFAHWLKGAGGMVGFPVLTAAAAELEKFAKANDMQNCGVAIRQLHSIASRIEVPTTWSSA